MQLNPFKKIVRPSKDALLIAKSQRWIKTLPVLRAAKIKLTLESARKGC